MPDCSETTKVSYLVIGCRYQSEQLLRDAWGRFLDPIFPWQSIHRIFTLYARRTCVTTLLQACMRDQALTCMHGVLTCMLVTLDLNADKQDLTNVFALA